MVQVDFNTPNGVEDGYIVDTHACGDGKATFNSNVEMYTGSLTSVCLGDSQRDVSRSYMSFDTSSIPNDATITAASLFVYFLGRVKPRVFNWSGILDQRLQLTIDEDEIGAALDDSDWDFSGTVIYNSVAFKNWTAAEWKEFTGAGNYINKTGDTDFMLWPNADWSTDCQAQNKHYYLRWSTVEGANDPYLRVTYTCKGKTYVQIIGAS